MKTYKRILSVVTMLALILSVIGIATVGAAAETITYTSSIQPYYYERIETDATENPGMDQILLDGVFRGYRPYDMDTKAAIDAGVVYYSTAALKDVQFVTALTDTNGWLGTATFYASSDGVIWQKIEETTRTKANYWGGADAHFEVYDAVSFTEEQNIRYLKVHFNVGGFNFPALYRIDTNAYDATTEATYTTELPANYYYAKDSENELVGVTEGVGMNFGGKSGTLTFTANDQQPISKFSAQFVLKWDWLNSHFKTEVSSDGENFKTVAPTFIPREDAFVNGGWVCRGYDIVGNFSKEENVRFIRFTLMPTIISANSMIHFKCNSYKPDSIEVDGAEQSAAYATSLIPENGTCSTGSLKSAADVGLGGWGRCDRFLFPADANGAWTQGTIDFYSENPIGDYRADMLWHGSGVTLYASVDGTDWTKLNPSIVDTGMDAPAGGGWGAYFKYFFGTLKAEADIHYLRIEFSERNPWVGCCPALYSLELNTAVPAEVEEETPAYEIEDVTSLKAIEAIKEMAANRENLDLTAEEDAKLTRAVVAADAALATGEAVTVADVQPKYDGTKMSTIESDYQCFMYDVKFTDFFKKVLTAKADAGATDLHFGALYIGRNATLSQMLTLEGNADYTVEMAITDIDATDVIPVRIRRFDYTELGQRMTVLPYVRWTENDETVYLYADSVVAKSPIGWLKQAVGALEGSSLVDAYNNRIGEMAAMEEYADVAANLDTMFKGIAATSNQVGALEVLGGYKTGADKAYYYQIMLDLFSFTN